MIADRKLWQRGLESGAYRRITAGEAPQTLGELAEQLLNWGRKTPPGRGDIKDRRTSDPRHLASPPG